MKQSHFDSYKKHLKLNILNEQRMKTKNLKLVKALTFLTLLLGSIVYCQESKTSLYTIAYGSKGICLSNVEGTSKVRLTNGNHGYPAWSPDGKHIAWYAYHDGKKTWSIHTINSDGTNSKRLTHEKNKWDNMPTWSPDGTKIAFAREYKDSAKVWHPEIWIMNSDGSEQTQIKSLSGGGPCFMSDGRLLFHSEFKDKESEISITDIEGKNIIHLTDDEAEDWDPKISPDGKKIAYSSKKDGNHEIYVMSIDGSNQKRLTNNDVDDNGPTWSPDGSQLVFHSNRGEHATLYIINIDGSSERKIINKGSQPAWFTTSTQENISNFPPIKDRYFGEKSPGLIPKLFAPNLLSPDGLFEGGGFSPDMKEYYFTRKNGKYKKRTFFVIRYENNKWGRESETNIKWPGFSKDGTIMYVEKKYRERTSTGWSEFKSQGEFLENQAHGLSRSSKGTCYFGFYAKEDKGNGSIRFSRIIDGKHEKPVKMGTEINTGKDIAHPHIATDESYLIWDVVREDGFGQADIYISFRDKDGHWLPAKNMGAQINTEHQESSPSVTPDGKYFFFTRGDWEIKEDGSTNYVGKKYWIDAKVIENLRPKKKTE
ncbi:DUF5050 domain-containing protein [Tenacibaculum larymnensis]|uniref:DUF5050 domain-containing protein n=1 Tax=Tenacibaculum larymnensis TaxID=2878201 RepID=A0A9X4IPX6_9FLAO|nr:DUF5050 domain-containing protein [Tenacibaculum larymnensis]MDE1206726.1 DUF5050 domain-containing protein [Tenacibaculum larymnensis]